VKLSGFQEVWDCGMNTTQCQDDPTLRQKETIILAIFKEKLCKQFLHFIRMKFIYKEENIS
jgi:hypothetical protein